MNPELLQAHAQRIRASGVLGRSELMQRLFDFLVNCSLADKAPKEIEIAIDVFGKGTQFEVARDAMVRVYMHKLRRKLEEYYAAAGRDESARLYIPRGEYRLVFETLAEATTTDDVDNPEEAVAEFSAAIDTVLPPARQSRRWFALAAAAVLALALTNLLVWRLAQAPPSVGADLRAVREHPVWQTIINDDKSVYLVVGDYYIFGELKAQSPSEPELVTRLVREFNVNSRNDLDQLLKDHPELAERYMDLALSYLPVSSAYALADVAPLLQAKRSAAQVQVIMASDLTPTMIRSSHVIYIGLISGMGILRDIAFAGSQFRIGDTYDELVDRNTNQMYVSQSSISINDKTRYRDYGYFATFAGPNQNRIVVLAGTRDVALMHVAEAATNNNALQELTAKSNRQIDFEALYAVDAIDRMNLDGRLLLAHKMDSGSIWAGGTRVAAVAAFGMQ